MVGGGGNVAGETGREERQGWKAEGGSAICLNNGKSKYCRIRWVFLNSIVEDLVQPDGFMDSYCCNKASNVVFLIRLF